LKGNFEFLNLRRCGARSWECRKNLPICWGTNYV